MPKKLNFLGGMQNYNENTGEYESALVGGNGKPVEDADNDGKKHEASKGFKSFGKKIDEDMKPAFESAKKIDSLYKSAKENDLDFERSLLNDIKSNPESYNKIVLDNKEYVRNGNGFDAYENGKHVWTGTYNSVARDINNYYADVEKKLNTSTKTFDEINEKRMNGKKEESKSEIPYDEIDGDYERSWGPVNFDKENNPNNLINFLIKNIGSDDITDSFNNASERLGELVKFSDKELDTLMGGTGEEIVKLLKSKKVK